MKKIIICLLVFLTTIHAEKLTIVNDIKNSKVFLNGVFIGKGSIVEREVQAGNEYNIQIKVENETVFRKTIIIGLGENRVINANTFVPVEDSKVANVGAKKVEAKRIKKATKGAFAMGGKFGNLISGASFKWYPVERFGTQFVFWATSTETNANLSYQGRLIYEVGDRLAQTDELYTFYVGVGLGRITDELNEAKIESVLLTDTKSENTTVYEAFIGLEFPGFNQISYWFLEGGYVLGQKKDTRFNGTSVTDSAGAFQLMGGIHIYF